MMHRGTLMLQILMAGALITNLGWSAEIKPGDPVITHLVPSEGADLSGSFVYIQKDSPPVWIKTTPTGGYVLLPFDKVRFPNDYSVLRPGTFFKTTAWTRIKDDATISLWNSVSAPGHRVNVIVDGRYGKPGTEGTPPPWSTMSVDLDLDGDTNHDGLENVNSVAFDDSAEDRLEADEENPGVIVAARPSDNELAQGASQFVTNGRLALRSIRPIPGAPKGRVTLSQKPIKRDGCDGGRLRFYRDTDLKIEITEETDLWNDLNGGNMIVYFYGENDEEYKDLGRVEVTLSYDAPAIGGAGTLYFEDKVNVTVIKPQIVVTPKFVAADTKADVPLYFKITGISKAYIQYIKINFAIDGVGKSIFYENGQHLMAGDVVRSNGLAGVSNGDVADYTVMISEAFFDLIPVNNPQRSHHTDQSNSVIYFLELRIKADTNSSAIYHCYSGTQEISAFYDRRIEFVESGVSETIDSLNKTTRQELFMFPSKPYLILNVVSENYSTPPGNPSGWVLGTARDPRYSPPVTQVQLSPTPIPRTEAQGPRLEFTRIQRNKVTNALNGYTLTAEVYRRLSDPPDPRFGTSFTSEIQGEDRGIYFGIYFGRKNSERPDLAGKTLGPVVDVRQIGFQNMDVDVFPRSKFVFTNKALAITLDKQWNIAAIAITALDTAALVCSLAGPEGFAGTAVFAIASQAITWFNQTAVEYNYQTTSHGGVLGHAEGFMSVVSKGVAITKPDIGIGNSNKNLIAPGTKTTIGTITVSRPVGRQESYRLFHSGSAHATCQSLPHGAEVQARTQVDFIPSVVAGENGGNVVFLPTLVPTITTTPDAECNTAP